MYTLYLNKKKFVRMTSLKLSWKAKNIPDYFFKNMLRTQPLDNLNKPKNISKD